MRRSDFEYGLPKSQIAQFPLKSRTAARLLVLDRASGRVVHTRFYSLHEFLRPGDLLVLNDTKVLRCRMLGRRAPTGGKVELFVLRRLDDGTFEALGKASRRLTPGSELIFGEGALRARVLDRKERRLIVSLSADGARVEEALERVAQVPLPPYIRRPDGPDEADEELYQTVYCAHPGAVAAPTAGLHFEDDYMRKLRSLGIQFTSITVHTGLGSFRPIRTENIEDHRMPAERFYMGELAADTINRARDERRRVIAVGTSCVRALETIAQGQRVVPCEGETDLYIVPGYEFSIVDAMVTNFHQPASSLLVLVSAFAGRDAILEAYAEALESGYRFLSFGDAMLIT
ncbi:MAG TPA: tRNA preQ1(34) S-adenosylmethionine ribosyltransferase-isomerase QueA [bacterium]|nr:tRNA preQ1(34) S-adenosylmethionine ribosyltransferase-isomerase QueA [bacterium]